MKALHFDPARLDVAAFAKAHATLQGRTGLERYSRLIDSTLQPADGAPGVADWVIKGLGSERAGRPPDVRLHLLASCTVWLECQRCLQPLAQPLVVDRLLRFVPGEEEAARLDEESEEDVLALPRALKLDELLEEELILSLPIVPVHSVCPVPIAYAGHAIGAPSAGPPGHADAPAHPFAALAGMKTPKPGA